MKLTTVEVEHLINLLRERQEEGSYYGRKDHYYNRTDKLLEKLRKELVKEKKHILYTMDCWCRPTIKKHSYGDEIVHNY